MKQTKETIKIGGRIRIIKTKSGTQEVLYISEWMNNLIVSGTNTGRNLIAQRLAGVNTFSLNITHSDIGTGTTTPNNNNTQLQTPVARAATASQTISNNVVILRFFFSDSGLPNGTYREFGTFIDGSTGVSTGRLFNRILFTTPYTKSTGEDSTFEVEITIN